MIDSSFSQFDTLNRPPGFGLQLVVNEWKPIEIVFNSFMLSIENFEIPKNEYVPIFRVVKFFILLMSMNLSVSLHEWSGISMIVSSWLNDIIVDFKFGWLFGILCICIYFVRQRETSVILSLYSHFVLFILASHNSRKGLIDCEAVSSIVKSTNSRFGMSTNHHRSLFVTQQLHRFYIFETRAFGGQSFQTIKIYSLSSSSLIHNHLLFITSTELMWCPERHAHPRLIVSKQGRSDHSYSVHICFTW